jgi:hypothetical protein
MLTQSDVDHHIETNAYIACGEEEITIPESITTLVIAVILLLL